ncbi:hypothetical protein HaLaN_10764 [Haematococcus lacustris]|uniref:Uncharacterized protein n=1 Tax=Haematococcus lacustris TaxID=44745 RepID=A0A699YZK9_HAELA|nr:hypothetical protein HaLaN_10764 [Haematococcus lacustris]
MEALVVCMDGAELQEAQDLNPEFMQRMREAAAMGGGDYL